MATNDEELSISVQKYEVLYDKEHPEFHHKDVKRNAWNEVAKDMGMEDGEFYSIYFR